MNGLDLPGLYQAAENVRGMRLSNLARQQGLTDIQDERARQQRLADLVAQYQQTPTEGPETPWGPTQRLGSLMQRAAAIDPQYLGRGEELQRKAMEDERAYRMAQGQRTVMENMFSQIPGGEQYAELARTMSPTESFEMLKRITPQATGEEFGFYQGDDGKWYAGSKKAGTLEKILVGGAPVTAPTADVDLQRRLSGAKKGAEIQAETLLAPEREKAMAAAKKEIALTGISDLTSAARGVLEGKELPTGSGFGSLSDAALRQFGITTKAGRQAAKLEAIGGALVGKMPRFEGPQSDADRQYYRDMAGKVGDRTIPVSERLAALEEVERIYASGKGPSGSVITKETQPAKVKRYNPATGRIE